MAWWNISHSCGHEERVQLYGPGADRERKAEWMESRPCPACWRAQKDADRAAENERAASLSGEIGFPALTGSEKQVAWAQSIRQKKYEESTKLTPGPHGWAPLVETYALETLAKWWIDNRSDDIFLIITKIQASHPAGYRTIAEKYGMAQEAGHA